MSEKCVNCERFIRNVKGRVKTVTANDDQSYMSATFGKTIKENDVLCNYCRLLIYKRRSCDPIDNFGIETSDTSDETFMLSSSKRSEPEEFIELPFPRLIATHKYCCICGSTKDLTVVPFDARLQCYSIKHIYIPLNNRCCNSHLMKRKFFEDDISHLKPFSNYSSVPISDICNIFKLSHESRTFDVKQKYCVTDKQLFAFTGLTWPNIYELDGILGLRNSSSRTSIQAIVVFLMKLRTGNSDRLLASILGLEYHQLVSEYVNSVITAFEKNVLPAHFGIHSTTRELIQSRTSEIAKTIIDANNDQLIIIFDGTYIRHQKSSNNVYQKKSYSGQKKTPLCKPFTICTTDGYVIDMCGPFNANLNDACIMKQIMSDINGLPKLLKPGDIIVVDRGFRDVVRDLETMGLKVLMPALKGNRLQLDTLEANKSRIVTKIRWVVESVHGILKQKYNLLDHKVDNKILPNIGTLCRIACFLNNKYGKRLISDTSNTDAIVTRLRTNSEITVNNMAQLVNANGWIRKKTIFKNISSNDLLDFPELTENDLQIFFGGSYQLKQSICYLAELQNADGSINIEFSKEHDILRIHIKSRHINKKTYHIFIRYVPNKNDCEGISDHFCTCPNGNRTAGCCSHIASIIYYLSNARYKSKIIKPAEILTNIFDNYLDNLTIINEDSDDD